MHTAVATTVQSPLLFPRTVKISGGSPHGTSLPMAHTVGGWVETADFETSAAARLPAFFTGEIAASEGTDINEPRRVYRNMELLLRSMGVSPVDGTKDDMLCLMLPKEELSFECVQAPAARTMAHIFEGHHRIADVMRRQGCEGRWQIWINRHYRDEQPVEEVLACMSTLSLRSAATGVLQCCPKGVGVVVTKYQPSTAERVHRRSVLPLYDMNTQRPKSLIMGGGLSLHIEGPFFHRYEPMEALLHTVEHRRRTTVVVMGNDEPGEYNDNVRQMQQLLDSAPAAVGGIVLLQPGNGSRCSASVAGVYCRRDAHIPIMGMLARRVKK